MDDPHDSGRYEIRVRGLLSDTLLGAFPELHARRRNRVTSLVGELPDQAALHGVLARVEALGLELVDVRRISPRSGAPSEPDAEARTRRRRPRTAPSASEGLLRGSLESLTDPFGVASAVRDKAGNITDHRIDYFNLAARIWAGVSEEQIIGASARMVYPALGPSGLFDAFSRVIETGEPFVRTAFEYADVLANGRAVRGHYDLQALKFGDRVIVIWRDVTEREAVLRERERLSSIVEESPDGILTTDFPELRITYVNPAFAGDLGLDVEPSSLLGQPVLELVDGILDANTVATLWEVASSGKPWLGEAEWRISEERSHRVEIRTTPRLAADGTLEGYLVVVRDVTSLREAEGHLARLAPVVEHALDFIIVTDRDGRIESVNPAFERLTGYPAEEVLGRTVSSVLGSRVESREAERSLDGARRRGDVWTGNVAGRRKDGSLLAVGLSLAPIRNAAGELIGTVEIGRDRSRELEVEAEHERESQIRTVLAQGLGNGNPAPGATLEQAAQAICDALVVLPFIDMAAIEAFTHADDVEILALAATAGEPPIAGTTLDPATAAIVRERSAGGPWAHLVASDPAAAGILVTVEPGLRAIAYGPIVRGGQALGALVIGTVDDRVAPMLVEQQPGVASFSATAGALLAEGLQTRRRKDALREEIRATLASGAFRPVFQPIVDLETREIVGYEALTRFDSGQRADLCFADAWSVDLGVELELATLACAVAVGSRLPAGRWLDLNISPRLLADPRRVADVLHAADRPLVLEITEHDKIEDYPAVREAVRALGKDVRIAVDDAGAGVANFGHIIELHPDFVKLDLGLVRRVNANMGRQAMVVGMRHFSRSAGCRLVAEGVETVAEARTLDELGVEFGQGFLFGGPEPVEKWAVRRSHDAEEGQLMLSNLLEDQTDEGAS